MPSSATSLHTLSVQNPRFHIHPLFWTSYHTSIVNCTFQQVDNHDTKVYRNNPFDDTADDVKRLATDLGPRKKSVWVQSMFRRPGSPITYISQSPYFSYNKHIVHHTCADLSVFCIKKEKVVDYDDPIIGYYRYNLSKERRQMLCPSRAPRGLTNNPVKRLYDIRFRRAVPKDWRQDPYLICLILSMAQLHQRKGTVALSGDIQTRLLVTHISDSTHAYVYKADIPQELLECLDNPKRSMYDFSFPIIGWVKVPFVPYATFADRLQSQLTGPSPTSLGPCGKKHKLDEMK